ncbi:MAG: magnesium and cobalt transport protein CorA [Sclerophora amabilis]|nr:MAG: magnesium and cobalt transport protein CorA [Sclerophora amabilis]
MASSRPQGGSETSPGKNPRPADVLPSSATSTATAQQTTNQSSSNMPVEGPAPPGAAASKKKKHRAGKKRRNRRQSFAMATDQESNGAAAAAAAAAQSGSSHNLLDDSGNPRPPFYRLGRSGRNLSNTSLESEALLDHRDQQPLPPRRQSTLGQSAFGARPNASARAGSAPAFEGGGGGSGYRQSYTNPFVEGQHGQTGRESDEEGVAVTDRTPLIGSSNNRDRPSSRGLAFRGFGGQSSGKRHDSANRRSSTATSTSSRQRKRMPTRQTSSGPGPHVEFDVNNPPSVPASPILNAADNYGDFAASDDFALPDHHRGGPTHDSIIDIDEDAVDDRYSMAGSPTTPRNDPNDLRRRTIALPVEGDVCFPTEDLSEMAEEDAQHLQDGRPRHGTRRKRGRQWPDLSVLEDWSREEKEERSEGNRAKTINEPVLVAGRLRPRAQGWHRAEEDAPYRFTYFNEEFPSTIHSQTISELVQPGEGFRELFIPDPPELSDDEDSSDDDLISHQDTPTPDRQGASTNGDSKTITRHPSIISEPKHEPRSSSGEATPSQHASQQPKQKRYGDRPTFWLDVLSPTEEEMRVLSKTFGIHPLTTEDIMTQEAREKVELFRNYYFVNYRTFEQDMNSGDFLQPVNMYAVVFRDGVISVSSTVA